MPSSYTASARFTLQATGENNNTWGVILNQGVFQLVDDAITGRLAFSLSGTKVLSTALGATDEARMAFLDVTGGSGGVITVPAVSKGYFLRNFSAGQVTISAGGSSSAVYQRGDSLPCFTDGATVYGTALGFQPIRDFITAGDAAVIAYVNAAISAGNQLLPPAAGATGKALIVRGAPGSEAWTPDFIQQADVVGLVGALSVLTAADVPLAGLNAVMSRAYYGDLF